MAEQHPNQIVIQSCTIRKFDSKGKQSYDDVITPDMIISFDFMESIESPTLSGQLLVSDSNNFINDFPIEGGEEIVMKFNHSFSEKAIEYKLRVYKIAGRISKDKMQTYSLMLVSEEFLINESVKMQDPLDGNSESLTIKLLREKLNSDKQIYSEPSRFKVRMIPQNMRPFDIIAKLIKKSVSSKTTYGAKREKGNNSKSEEQIKGSAGFFFWETRRGYNFFSIDALCDVSKDQTFIYKRKGKTDKKPKPQLQSAEWGPYVETIANVDAVDDSRFKITAFEFDGEVDIATSLRMGKYSSRMVFWNHSTGQYDEYVYKINDSYNNMAHLGGQSKPSSVPGNTDELSDKPTRIMSAILDPETWQDEPKVVDPDVPSVENPTEYADWTKYYAAQSVTRVGLLSNQEAIMKVPVNPMICAGDKVSVLIQSKRSDAERKLQQYDTESSGVYLVKQVTHTYDFVNSFTGNGYTTLRLFRDSYGTDLEKSVRGETKDK
jgi:hypothetical protein